MAPRGFHNCEALRPASVDPPPPAPRQPKIPAPLPPEAKEGDCDRCPLREAEAQKLAWLLSMQSAAISGELTPAMPYEGKPLEPIEEGLRLRLAVGFLAEALANKARGTVAGALKWAMSRAREECPEPRGEV